MDGQCFKRMTSVDPLKTVISIDNVDDTSLALPSANQLRTGQQRVLEQVQTVRRIKTRKSSSRSGSTSMSPTSPVYDSVFTDSSKTSAANGSVFFGNANGFSQSLNLERPINRQTINSGKGSTVKRNTSASAYQYDKGFGTGRSVSIGQTSRSEPDLAWQRSMPKRSGPSPALLSNVGTYRAERTRSQLIKGTISQPQPQPQLQQQYQSQSQGHMYSLGLLPSPTQVQAQAKARSQQQLHTQSQVYTQTSVQPVFTAANGAGLTKTSTKFISSKDETIKAAPKTPVQGSASYTKELGLNGNAGVADITIEEAVDFLSLDDETYQHCGASFIQHNSFIDDKTKEEVLKLNGIPPLVNLLHSPSEQVNQTASAALRNLSFKSNSSKEEMHRCGGITEAVALLRETDSAETKKQLTGLLWNLSSVDSLKPDLLNNALPVLMERVILPYATGPDRATGDPEVFFHATACLRNISSSKQSNRQAMRKCRGLVDSLVGYVEDSVEAGRPDDKSVENCVCILHNLTFQLENEVPTLFSRIQALARDSNKSQTQGEVGPIGCFNSQSKTPDQERHFDFPIVEEPQPSGAAMLIHSKTLQSYLSLLESSQVEETQEACCGAMQNLTTHEGIVSRVMSQIIVQKLNGMRVIGPLLKSDKVNLQRSTAALVRNLTKNPNLRSTLARKALPELTSILREGTKEGNESDDTLAMACQTADILIRNDPESGRHLLNNKLINSLSELSQNGYLPKSKKAASLLLFNLWSDKDLQSFLKKQGMMKTSFVNDVTTAAHRSVQVVD